MANTKLRFLWSRLFKFNWVFGLILLVAICVPRFWMVLNANLTGNYGSIGIIMAISALVPFIFLSKEGRKQIGVTKPKNYTWILYSFLAGIAISAIIFALGYILYTNTLNNWFVYIGRSYNIATDLNAQDKLIYFIVFAVTGMCFSPIGEELFFRGIVHSSFSVSLGEKQATIIDSLAFALTHLAHFGIVFIYDRWKFLFIPSILWVLAMFITSLIFIQCKKKTGSIIGAIASHAGFNLAMIYLIFYQL
ncbi:CPBP family intramembrane glutamic endopeptidase [Adhaeribacter aquaticus]|uniref:CPBP family intramembrane glutamic endopeptidase n=1 Tax=Adhaeribacter aquaticus TaxID=299567 RepID=UPI000411B576|nr:CPBP family intramembrane glutamic endopeptidase [Adhaeribacter aquaticus]